MKDTLAKICELQTKYSSSNTEEMRKRGYLIRTELAQEVRDRLPTLRRAFDSVFDDLAVEGSDGIGRKTEAPWVRLYSKAMSPSAREGFYLVIHFAANGSAVFFTVGCGSTIWSGGDLRAIPDEELKRRTSWARSIVEQSWKSIAPYDDEILLGAKADLPRTFEKATAIARRVSVGELGVADLDDILFGAAERLAAIYVAQIDQRDLSQGDRDANAIDAIARPLSNHRRGQGIGLTGPERKAVERRAMELAVEYLTADGYQCRDVSSTEPFDLLASKGDVSIKTEVKGTTSDMCYSIMMTKNEVELHRKEKGSTALIVVSRIKLMRENGEPRAEGGELEALLKWDIDEWSANPIAYQVSRP